MPDNIGVEYGADLISASSGNVAAATATATIAAHATKVNYLTGFVVTASGATAGLPVLLTVTGLVGGTQTFIFTAPAGVLVGATPLVVNYSVPQPTTAINTAIVVSMPTLGAGNTNAAIVASGFRA